MCIRDSFFAGAQSSASRLGGKNFKDQSLEIISNKKTRNELVFSDEDRDGDDSDSNELTFDLKTGSIPYQPEEVSSDLSLLRALSPRRKANGLEEEKMIRDIDLSLPQFGWFLIARVVQKEKLKACNKTSYTKWAINLVIEDQEGGRIKVAAFNDVAQSWERLVEGRWYKWRRGKVSRATRGFQYCNHDFDIIFKSTDCVEEIDALVNQGVTRSLRGDRENKVDLISIDEENGESSIDKSQASVDVDITGFLHLTQIIEGSTDVSTITDNLFEKLIDVRGRVQYQGELETVPTTKGDRIRMLLKLESGGRLVQASLWDGTAQTYHLNPLLGRYIILRQMVIKYYLGQPDLQSTSATKVQVIPKKLQPDLERVLKQMPREEPPADHPITVHKFSELRMIPDAIQRVSIAARVVDVSEVNEVLTEYGRKMTMKTITISDEDGGIIKVILWAKPFVDFACSRGDLVLFEKFKLKTSPKSYPIQRCLHSRGYSRCILLNENKEEFNCRGSRATTASSSLSQRSQIDSASDMRGSGSIRGSDQSSQTSSKAEVLTLEEVLKRAKNDNGLVFYQVKARVKAWVRANPYFCCRNPSCPKKKIEEDEDTVYCPVCREAYSKDEAQLQLMMNLEIKDDTASAKCACFHAVSCKLLGCEEEALRHYFSNESLSNEPAKFRELKRNAEMKTFTLTLRRNAKSWTHLEFCICRVED
eukprot:TRINITY_DN12521_c0_g2_i1.p1 TRINITY_DN12521_c0_g2~~TRINITY_DN12521_c0_g2_i1.p1  ORF type:complete len:704 (+),score=33.79 TRINITY_DN12521_c0_g2_i1:65-2176(+)